MGIKEDLDYIWNYTPIQDPLRKARWQAWMLRDWLITFGRR